MADRLDTCCVRASEKIVDAMRSLERSNTQIVLVVEDHRKIVGTLTDGDIRRALIGGATLDSPLLPFTQKKFVSVTPEAGRADVLELMQVRSISQIPVVDADHHLVGLHLLHEILGMVERPNWAVIMAGGKGTRLRPITEHIPKPMIPVAGRPILERIVHHLVYYGIRRIFLSVNYMSEVIQEHFGDGSRFGCGIEYLREASALGTGGPLSLLPRTPPAPLLALNGDLIVQFNVAELLSFHERGDYRATVAVHRYTHTVPFGTVEVVDGRVSSIQEKPTVAWNTNAGIYVLNPELPARVPKGTEYPMPALLEDCLRRGEGVGAFELQEDWIDVGMSHELQRARRTMPEKP